MRPIADRVPLRVAALLADDEVEALRQRAERIVDPGGVPGRALRPPLPVAAGVTGADELVQSSSTAPTSTGWCA